MVDVERVIVDNDFIHKIFGIRKDVDRKDVFRNIFRSCNLYPVLHPFIYENELSTNAKEEIDSLIKEGTVSVLTYEEITFNGTYSDLYDDNIREYYYKMHGRQLPENIAVRNRYAGNDLGEIHSLTAAYYLGLHIFMSNDKGAKILAHTTFNTNAYALVVKNMDEVIIDIKTLNDSVRPDWLTRDIERALCSKGG